MNPEEKFQLIYRENYPRVIGMCLGYVGGDEDLAKDLAQEVFLKVWENLNSFRHQSKVSTWIYRITVNTCLQQLRKKKYVSLKEGTNLEVPTEGDDREINFKALYRCIDKLSADNKAIILLELQEVPQKEMAQIIGISHQAIRTRIHRIKLELSKCVNNE